MVDNNTPYVVISPGEVEAEQELSPWLNMESPDVESDEAMTPINPSHVNPVVAAAETPVLKYPVINAVKSLVVPKSNPQNPQGVKGVTGQKLKDLKTVGKNEQRRVIQIPPQPQPASKAKKRGAVNSGKKPRKNVQPRKKIRCNPNVK